MTLADIDVFVNQNFDLSWRSVTKAVAAAQSRPQDDDRPIFMDVVGSDQPTKKQTTIVRYHELLDVKLPPGWRWLVVVNARDGRVDATFAPIPVGKVEDVEGMLARCDHLPCSDHLP
jgi:hypothetical protein